MRFDESVLAACAFVCFTVATVVFVVTNACGQVAKW